MKRTHGLISLAVLHHVTVGLALLAMLAGLLNSNPNIKLVGVLQLSAFGFFSVIVRRAWASIDGGAQGLSPGKAQGFLWIPFFNFYWVFPAFVSLATETNAKAVAEGIDEALGISPETSIVIGPEARRSRTATTDGGSGAGCQSSTTGAS